MENQKFGHFDDLNREYVITDPKTPWPSSTSLPPSSLTEAATTSISRSQNAETMTSEAESLMIAGLFVVCGRDYVELCRHLGKNEEADRADRFINDMVEVHLPSSGEKTIEVEKVCLFFTRPVTVSIAKASWSVPFSLMPTGI